MDSDWEEGQIVEGEEDGDVRSSAGACLPTDGDSVEARYLRAVQRQAFDLRRGLLASDGAEERAETDGAEEDDFLPSYVPLQVTEAERAAALEAATGVTGRRAWRDYLQEPSALLAIDPTATPADAVAELRQLAKDAIARLAAYPPSAERSRLRVFVIIVAERFRQHDLLAVVEEE